MDSILALGDGKEVTAFFEETAKLLRSQGFFGIRGPEMLRRARAHGLVSFDASYDAGRTGYVSAASSRVSSPPKPQVQCGYACCEQLGVCRSHTEQEPDASQSQRGLAPTKPKSLMAWLWSRLLSVFR